MVAENGGAEVDVWEEEGSFHTEGALSSWKRGREVERFAGKGTKEG